LLRALVLVALLVLPACGDDADGIGGPAADGAACGPDQQERVDPASANHVLAGGDEPEYTTDPPTSGPHEPGPVIGGVLDDPLSRPQQVGQLEAGAVLLQHRDLTSDQLADLQALAGEQVIVAPNPDLPAPVVATAWTRKMTCEAVDAQALAAFAETHAGSGPGTDG
jgi:hypothetical protein